MVLGQLDEKQKNEVEPYLTPYTKMNTKWIRDGEFFNSLNLIDLLKYLRDFQRSLDHTLRTTHPDKASRVDMVSYLPWSHFHLSLSSF